MSFIELNNVDVIWMMPRDAIARQRGNYCSELVTKYEVGTSVNSTKLPNEPPLNGKYYLEIPASNQNAQKLEQFKRIASEYGTENGGISIIFLNE